MFGRLRAWLQDLANVSQIIVLLLLLGVSQLLAPIIFSLSLLERVLLGICVFLLALVGMLVVYVYKGTLGQRSHINTSQSTASSSQSPAQQAVRVQQSEAQSDELPFPLPHPLPPDVLTRHTLSNLSFRLVDLIAPEQVMNQTNVRDRTFYKCTIHGPAILIPRDTRFEGNNEFVNYPQYEHPQSMLYLYPQVPDRNRTWFSGTVATRECVFRDCTFVDIGFMHYEPNLERLRNHIAGKGDIQTF